MRLHRIALTLSAAVLAASLSACGGGGHSSAAVPGAASTPTPVTGGNVPTSSGARLTVTFLKSSTAKKPTHKPAFANRKTAAKHRVAQTAGKTRKPKYISGNTGGFQISVTSGTKTQVAYESATGTNCVANPSADFSDEYETCTYALPSVGATESISVTEVDQAPTTDGNGTPTGFATGTNVLAIGSTTATLAAGVVTNVSVQLGEVVAQIAYFDCGYSADSSVGEFEESDASVSGNPRLVFTSGVSTQGYDSLILSDATGNHEIASTAPITQFVDANGAPTAITTTSTASGFTSYAIPYPQNNATSAPTYATTGTIADSSYFYNEGAVNSNQPDAYGCVYFAFNYDGSPVANGSAFTVANNLTAADPFSPTTTYGASVVFSLTALAVTPATLNLAYGGTGTVTATDYDSLYDMDTNNCNTSSGTTIATVQSAADLSPTTFTEPFTVTATGSGTCTFALEDDDTGIDTTPVTVTIAAPPPP